MYQLSIQNGPGGGRRVTVRAGDLSIGSGPDCDLRVMMDGLAPNHARVRTDGAGARIEASAGAPLAVNGKVGAAFSLSDGDRIVLGTLRLQYRNRTASPARAGARRPTGLHFSTVAVLLFALGVQLAVIGTLRTLSVKYVPPKPAPAEKPEPSEAEVEKPDATAGESGAEETPKDPAPKDDAPLWPPSDAARKILF